MDQDIISFIPYKTLTLRSIFKWPAKTQELPKRLQKRHASAGPPEGRNIKTSS